MKNVLSFFFLDQQWMIITLAMIGKLAITASYVSVYIFSSEQFPTVIRNAGLGAGSTCARIGSIMAPYINIMVIFFCLIYRGNFKLYLIEAREVISY